MRLIIDCRLATAHFGEPDDVSLATGASMGGIEVDTSGPVAVGQVDIADGLKSLTAGEAGISVCCGQAVKADDAVVPRFAAAPMGRSLA